MAAANTSRSPSTSPNRTNTYASDPSLYLYTSLTAGSSHIITATSRLETILKGNKLDFKAIDIATDERARTLWSRRARGKKLPGLVKYGTVIGNIDEVDEWNEEEILLDKIENVPGRIEPELEKPKADNKTATAASSATSPKETETAAKAKPTETSKETKEMGDDDFKPFA
ncbi:hypothetical protein KEM55_007117 [Ascosphaera atra]|nr:hypothetical protein KEM55_007117 [Ascosphaera atra]